jgi:hypothetical protein
MGNQRNRYLKLPRKRKRSTAMNQVPVSPFDSIEDAHEFLTLLAQTVFEAKLEIETDVQRESSSNFPRRTEALKLALYTLTRLEFHMNRSRRVLNDLRTLRRLLFEERTLTALSQRPQTNGRARAETLLPPSRPLSQTRSSVGRA